MGITVKELREMLNEAPDDMPVMVLAENHLKPGMFAFSGACSCETGVVELGPTEDGGAGGEMVFLVARHGSGIVEGSEEDKNETIPELN